MQGKFPNGLKDAMAAKGIGPSELARLLDTSKQNVQRWREGERRLTPDWAEKIAPYVDVRPEQLVFPSDDDEPNIVPVVGRIAAGGAILVDSEQLSATQPLFEIAVPFAVPSDAFALQVGGDSMWPRYDDGDVIICTRQSQNPAPLIGWEAAVGTQDGNRYLKRLMKGSREGLYDLESHNAATMRDVAVSWASEVFGVVRAARWRRLDDRGRRREMRKALL